MVKIAIVYHSGFGHTQVQAKRVHKGASSVAGVEAQLFMVQDLNQDASPLNGFDAIIFGSPTYMGSVSAPFKTFMDTSSKQWFGKDWKDKIAAGFTNSHSLSGDKLNTLVTLAVFAAQHGMIWVGQAEPNGSPDGKPGEASAVNRVGSALGAMAQSENAAPDVTPPEGDLLTAELLGVRVAQITKQFKS